MEFKNERLGCRFTLPDRPTVRQQLAFYSEFSEARDGDKYEKYFAGVRPLIQDWECAVLPDPAVDLDSISDPTQAMVIVWAGTQAARFMNRLEDLPKNG